MDTVRPIMGNDRTLHGSRVLEQLSRLDTCVISDALDRIGIGGVVHGVFCRSRPNLEVAGRAITVRVVPRRDDNPRPHLGSRAVAMAGPGDVIVLSNGGRLDVSCWGGLLSLAAHERGVEGVVIDGACRDVAEAGELGLPVFARAAVPTSARGRVVEESTGEPITFGSIAVETGDLVRGDRNGVVFVPAERADDVLGLADRLVVMETNMAEAIRSGTSIVEVMHDRSFQTG